jgi:osmotically-inducible protein OsmY
MIRIDEDIKKDVVDQLYWDSRVNAADIKVDVLNGQVTLGGSVPTLTARFNALDDAWMVSGVNNIIDRLEIIHPSGFIVPIDSEIRENIENALHWNADIYSDNISVFVEGGVVTLKGTVDAYWKKWKADDLASSVKGVVSVVNELAIVSTGKRLDQDIATDIGNALERNPIVDSENVIVKVENGKVILTGVVPTWRVWTEAGNIARFTFGVVEVENNLKVEIPEPMTV